MQNKNYDENYNADVFKAIINQAINDINQVVDHWSPKNINEILTNWDKYSPSEKFVNAITELGAFIKFNQTFLMDESIIKNDEAIKTLQKTSDKLIDAFNNVVKHYNDQASFKSLYEQGTISIYKTLYNKVLQSKLRKEELISNLQSSNNKLQQDIKEMVLKSSMLTIALDVAIKELNDLKQESLIADQIKETNKQLEEKNKQLEAQNNELNSQVLNLKNSEEKVKLLEEEIINLKAVTQDLQKEKNESEDMYKTFVDVFNNENKGMLDIIDELESTNQALIKKLNQQTSSTFAISPKHLATVGNAKKKIQINILNSSDSSQPLASNGSSNLSNKFVNSNVSSQHSAVNTAADNQPPKKVVYVGRKGRNIVQAPQRENNFIATSKLPTKPPSKKTEQDNVGLINIPPLNNNKTPPQRTRLENYLKQNEARPESTKPQNKPQPNVHGLQKINLNNLENKPQENLPQNAKNRSIQHNKQRKLKLKDDIQQSKLLVRRPASKTNVVLTIL